MRHILTVQQFSIDDLNELCENADAFSDFVDGSSLYGVGRGKLLANLFYEPSTRTSSSFYSAMVRLGGHVIPINAVQYSSVAKGETLEDTIRTMGCYADVIVLRHPEPGAAQRAAKVSEVPIINAGDGDNEHPTQALLDLYTILHEHPNFRKGEALRVVMMGDLLRGRTVKSLSLLLRKYNVTIDWVSPRSLRVPTEYKRDDEIETDDLAAVITDADVVYLTRVQHERGEQQDDHVYGITSDHMALAKAEMLLMHPLPRLTELPTSLDADPRSAYFRQMRYGLYMRMAVLADVLTT